MHPTPCPPTSGYPRFATCVTCPGSRSHCTYRLVGSREETRIVCRHSQWVERLRQSAELIEPASEPEAGHEFGIFAHGMASGKLLLRSLTSVAYSSWIGQGPTRAHFHHSWPSSSVHPSRTPPRPPLCVAGLVQLCRKLQGLCRHLALCALRSAIIIACRPRTPDYLPYSQYFPCQRTTNEPPLRPSSMHSHTQVRNPFKAPTLLLYDSCPCAVPP